MKLTKEQEAALIEAIELATGINGFQLDGFLSDNYGYGFGYKDYCVYVSKHNIYSVSHEEEDFDGVYNYNYAREINTKAYVDTIDKYKHLFDL